MDSKDNFKATQTRELFLCGILSGSISNALDATQNDAIWEEDESERNDEIEWTRLNELERDSNKDE